MHQMLTVQWVPDYPNADYPNADYPNSRLSERLDIAMFSAAAGKDVPVTRVLLQEKAKLLYERLFQMLQRLFQPVQDLDHILQHPSLAS